MVSSSVNALIDVGTGAYSYENLCWGTPLSTTEQDLVDLFAQVGHVTSATVITDRASGRSKGFGFVEMSNDQEARAAIERLNGTILGNRTIIVNEARERQATDRRQRY